jgi:predicted transcriptional regulator of viral defense system
LNKGAIKLKYYERLVELGCFTRDDVAALTGNRETAHSIIEAYKKKGLIESVRRDLFVAMSLETKQPVPNRYAIASNAAQGAYVSYHSAFEYQGLANQVYYEVFTASPSRFRIFEHGGITYRYVASPFCDGVDNKADGTRVTDLERTVIDGIDDFEKAGGLEELLRCIGMIPYLDGVKLLSYLSSYNKLFLYQKAGYILEHFKDSLKLADDFFTACQGKVPKNKRYLYDRIKHERRILNKSWALYVPDDLMALIKKGAYYGERVQS